MTPRRVSAYLFAACLLVMAVDVSVPHSFTVWWWRIAYPLVAFGLLVWHHTRRRWALSLVSVVLISASGVRAVVFALQGGPWSGMAINVIVAILVNDSVRSRRLLYPDERRTP